MRFIDNVHFWGDLLLRNWLFFVAIGLAVWLTFLGLVFLSWFAAFWGNIFLGWKADLASCWQGVGAIGIAFGSIAALGGLAWARDYVDGRYNTPEGVSRWDLQDQTQQPAVHVEIAKEE